MSSVEKLSNNLYVNHFYMSYYKEKENYKNKNKTLCCKIINLNISKKTQIIKTKKSN